MGDINQYRWIEKHIDLVHPPILEIGSKWYGEAVSFDFRALLSPRGAYIGTDLSAGRNVDVVADLTSDPGALPEALLSQRFGTIICMSVMEHVRDIFSFARNVTSLVAEGGVLFLSVPWIWRYHGYPADFWRFSPLALEFLFPAFELVQERSCVHEQEEVRVAPCKPESLGRYHEPRSRIGRLWSTMRGRLGQALPRVWRPQALLRPTMVDACFRKRLPAEAGAPARISAQL